MAVWVGNWFINETYNVKAIYASNGFDGVYRIRNICCVIFIPGSLKMSVFFLIEVSVTVVHTNSCISMGRMRCSGLWRQEKHLHCFMSSLNLSCQIVYELSSQLGLWSYSWYYFIIISILFTVFNALIAYWILTKRLNFINNKLLTRRSSVT